MKPNRLVHFVAAVIGVGAFSTARCAEKAPATTAVQPPVTATAGVPATATATPVATTVDPASARWSDIKDETFETRDRFFAGLARLEARVDQQVGELKAKRATMKGLTGTAEWDFAMKEMFNARAYLKSTGEVLGESTRETWDSQKDRVGQAWVRTQDAYAKVKSSTTL